MKMAFLRRRQVVEGLCIDMTIMEMEHQHKERQRMSGSSGLHKLVIINRWLKPSLVSVGSNGKRTTIIETPAFIVPFICPFPCFLFICLFSVAHYFKHGHARKSLL